MSEAVPTRSTPSDARAMLMSALRRTAVIAGLFCLSLWLGLLVQHFIFKANDPLTSDRLDELKQQLRSAPKDERIKEEIRALDLQLRHRYFQHLKLTGTGGWLLFSGGTLFLVLATATKRARQKPFLPTGRLDLNAIALRTKTLARTSLGAIGIITLAAMATIAFSTETKLPATIADLEKNSQAIATESPAIDLPTPEEFNRNWPRFRGPANGVSFDTNPPASFDAAHLLWKTEVPAVGFNSPIVWGNRIFLSGGDASLREEFCFSTDTGHLLWRKAIVIPNSAGASVSIPEATGHAPNTMATDGRRVYVIFPTYDIAALTFDGEILWSKNLGKPNNEHGHSSSLATWQDRLIVQLDQGSEDDRASRLYAFDGKTGEIVWQRPRPVGQSWTSPIIMEANGKTQIVTLAAPWAIAYSANDGNELWRFSGLHGEVTSSAAAGAGLVFAITAYETLFAIKADGQGDVTGTHLAWKSEDNAPDISSPAANEEFLFVLSTPGLLTCFETKTGKKLWEHDLQIECFASPIIAGNRVYLLASKGTVIVIEAGPVFRELSRAELNEGASATPAFSGNKVFIRGHKHLFCFGNQVKQLAEK